MESTVVAAAFSLVLLAGCGALCQTLPPGPVVGAVGGEVTFPTTVDPVSAPVFQSINWTFYNSSANVVIIFNVNTTPNITKGKGYADRVTLNTITGSLQLTNLTLNDSGQYSVSLRTEENALSDGNATLNVYERISGINITGTPGQLFAGNSSATLNCSETYGTGIVREWLKDGEQLFPSNRITFSGDNRSVSIEPVEGVDNGQYQCRLTNPVGTGTADYQLTVIYGPETAAIFGDTIAQIGSAVLLYCSTASVPASVFTWTVNDTETEVNTALYLIKNSSYTDSGNYSCTAWNTATNLRASAVHMLHVTDKVGSPACSGLTPGETAGIAVGTIAVVAVLALAVYFGLRHGRLLSSCSDLDQRVHLQNTQSTNRGEKSNTAQHEMALDGGRSQQQTTKQQGTLYENIYPEPPQTNKNRGPPLPPRDLPKEPPSWYSTSFK